jgi:hypothetical protein
MCLNRGDDRDKPRRFAGYQNALRRPMQFLQSWTAPACATIANCESNSPIAPAGFLR